MKVEVEDPERDRLLVLLVEKVDLLVMVQTMVVVLKVLVVAAELKVLQFVKEVEYHFH